MENTRYVIKLKMKYIKEYKEINWDDWEIEEEPLSSEFIGHEKFYNFLKENNVLEDFIHYFYSEFGGYKKGWPNIEYTLN